jgi:hypothetical protein
VAFKYRIRATENWEARANQSGSDYEGFIKDEYRTYTPVGGENHVRILPPSPMWENANHYGCDVWVHYGVGPERASIICLYKMKGEACPICEERVRAERAHDEDLARDLKPSRRVLAFILNRKDEGQGVLAWAMPYTIDRDINKACKDRSTGEYYHVDDPENGYDIYFDRDGEGLTTKYSGVSLARRPSAIPQKYWDWLDDKPLPEVLRWRDYAEVKRLYEGSGRGEAASDNERPVETRVETRREPERAAQREPERQAIQRPRSNGQPIARPAAAPVDADLPFDKEADDKPEMVAAKPEAETPTAETKAEAPPPSSQDAKDRAAQLRARFAARPQ